MLHVFKAISKDTKTGQVDIAFVLFLSKKIQYMVSYNGGCLWNSIFLSLI